MKQKIITYYTNQYYTNNYTNNYTIFIIVFKLNKISD